MGAHLKRRYPEEAVGTAILRHPHNFIQAEVDALLVCAAVVRGRQTFDDLLIADDLALDVDPRKDRGAVNDDDPVVVVVHPSAGRVRDTVLADDAPNEVLAAVSSVRFNQAFVGSSRPGGTALDLATTVNHHAVALCDPVHVGLDADLCLVAGPGDSPEFGVGKPVLWPALGFELQVRGNRVVKCPNPVAFRCNRRQRV